MAPNVELMEKTLEHIEKHPEQWEQLYFRCGTGMCFAGHAAFLAGARWQIPGDDMDEMIITPAGDIVDVGTYAMDVLRIRNVPTISGYYWSVADQLFDGANTLNDLRNFVRQIKETGTITDDTREGDDDAEH